ncbi:MAG TPA: hypothetical protein VJ246_04200 [Patescibacteria group bacterium]|nr:hypothetical protein [Patescibacteria group bacterium]
MKTHIQSTTQTYLEIFDITNDTIILKDSSVAMVLSVGSLNFGLLAEEEQDAIIYTYAGLLNSLTFPVEIVIRSQKKDVTAYLRYVKEWEDKTLSPLRKTQIRRYREFVSELVKERRILDKKFYVAIPFRGTAAEPKGAIPQIKKKEIPQLDRAYILERALTDLEPKRDHLISQFARIGLNARQLNTQELIQLLYTIYNPGSYEGQKMGDTRSYTTAAVEASLSGVIQQPALQTLTKDNTSSGAIASTASASPTVEAPSAAAVQEPIAQFPQAQEVVPAAPIQETIASVSPGQPPGQSPTQQPPTTPAEVFADQQTTQSSNPQ